MTPEQIQQLIDHSVNQHDLLWLVAILFAGVIGFFIAYFGAYARQKGQNLATKEDISTLTHTVESIKTDFATKQHFSQIRYERELKVYEELWPKLCDLQTAALSLRPVADWGPTTGKSEDEIRGERRKCFLEAHSSVFLAVNISKPFYSEEVWKQIQELIKLCWGEAVEWGLFSSLWRERMKREDYWDKQQKNFESINKQIDITCEAIRTRLSKFDS